MSAIDLLTGFAQRPIEAATINILIVDDSPTDRLVTVSLLKDMPDTKIWQASNGREALQAIAEVSPTLVLTDLNMPEMNGLELVEEIRSDHPTLPIILMTAHGSEDLALQALQAGAASYVPKRLLADHLIPTVEHIISAARQERRRNRVLECITRLDAEFELENDPTLVPHVIAHVQEQMLRMKLCDLNGKIRIGVALEESLLNGIYHGNLELSSDLRQDGSNRFNELAEQRRLLSPYRDRRLHVRVTLTVRETSFVVRDEGPGFDIAKIPDPTDPENLLKASGRGLLLIRTFMDQVIHNANGNQITMIKRCD
ncbi:MAG: response regulator [Planctomycetes bacterium]|nr:response regulator [Planctomycetota bacterium]